MKRPEVHWRNAQGTVACNPRDREAAHRADQGKLVVADAPGDVTCRKCRAVLHTTSREERGGR